MVGLARCPLICSVSVLTLEAIMKNLLAVIGGFVVLVALLAVVFSGDKKATTAAAPNPQLPAL
jgi:hypothetical protein